MTLGDLNLRWSVGGMLTLLAPLFMIGSSSAADLSKIPTKAQPPVSFQSNWSGFYFGANAGYGWGKTDMHFVDFGGSDLSPRTTGVVGGGQIGYLFQNGNIVYGVEASLGATGLKGSGNAAPGAASCNPILVTCRVTNVDWLVMVDARLGWANGPWLLYGLGGYAGAQVKTDAIVIATGAAVIPDKRWHNGWNVGLGGEYAFTPKVSFGIEYRYIDLGSQRHGESFGAGNRSDVVPKISMLMARVNFRL